MKTSIIIPSIVCLALASCVSTTSTAPDGTVTKSNSFAPTVDQLNAATALAEAIKSKGGK